MKKILIIIIALVFTFSVTGCSFTKQEETDALKFKEEYESLNGTTNSAGKKHRSISIDEDNPFLYVSAEEIVEKINNGYTFYVYFGSKLCPWCRSVIEKTIQVAKEHNIKTIYYVDIWDDDGNEILRDVYALENGIPTMQIEGTEAYYQLLSLLDNVLSEYTLSDGSGNTVNVGEKRIYGPNFIYIENGNAIKLTEGTSSKQTDSRMELTDEILEDEEYLLNEFFTN